ncbi:PD-(D/E)XK nuclease family protein [Zavarzinella formosa]|uniref:PD-(D/E)XK nuclease family protein n=1 Tax=Zavarzinella formosa TaxID=360055 RepID=UPI0003070BD9|nr:PD-(D/E)XK nuclease family protein [Zavarzinella formosa]
MDAQGNLFLRLHKWASRQDENFVTESFAYLLRHLIEAESLAASRFLRSFSGGFFDLKTDEARTVNVRTQIFSGEGTPDLALNVADRLAYIEVKVESPATAEQLLNYRRLLDESAVPHTQLILLTRYPVDIKHAGLSGLRFVRWYEVSEWLVEQQAKYKFQAVGEFLAGQFLEFLGSRSMSMAQVSWELTGGIRALRNFSLMLAESAHAAGVRVTPQGTYHETGAWLDGKAYWIGIDFEMPNILKFMTWKRPVDPKAAQELGVGEIHEWTNKSAHGWERKLDLAAEDVHFFALSRASQMQILEAFIKESVELARRVELTASPSRSEGDDETDE